MIRLREEVFLDQQRDVVEFWLDVFCQFEDK
jgi:hypothetical protein